MRRILAPLAALAVAISAAGPVAAAPAQRFSDVQTVLFCEHIPGEDGTLFLVAAQSEEFGTFADLGFWFPGGDAPNTPPDWFALTSSVTFGEGTITGTYALYEFEVGENPEEPPIGDPVGDAVLSVTLTPDGDPEPYEFGDGSGNAKTVQTGTIQQYLVTGTIELPGDRTFDLSSCEAWRDEFTFFQTSPASNVTRMNDFQLNCTWELGDTFVGMFAAASDGFAHGDVFVSSPSGELSGFSQELTLTPATLAASWELAEFDPETGPGDVVGSASASATLSATGETFHEKFSFGTTTIHQRGEIYTVDGVLTLETPDGTLELVMDGESCFAAEMQTMQHESARRGPRGRPLANDAPENALPLVPGESVTVRTGGADLEAEAPCVGEQGGEVGEFPIGKTGWWTFEGTGSPMTVDTAGSDFDTVVGVYVEEEGSLVPIACVDDTEMSLQAAVTVDSTAGVTYWVQAGGLGGQSGTLVLSLE